MGNSEQYKNKSKSFIGFCNYYRKFVNGFAKIAAPLTNLTRKENSFKWTKSEKEFI